MTASWQSPGEKNPQAPVRPGLSVVGCKPRADRPLTGFSLLMPTHVTISFLLLFLWPVLSLGNPRMIPLGPDGGDVRSLAVHPARPERFFLGTADGQIFASHDAGGSWKRLLPGLGRRGLVVDNLVFHPRDPDTLYAATWELENNRGSLFRTRNAGASWENISLGLYQSSTRALAISPSDPNVVAVGISEGVILSRDEGNTWDRITRGYRSLYNVESLAFDPHHSQTLYAGTFHLGWKTTDGGETWQAVHRGMISDSDLFSLLVHPQNPQVLYSSACTGVYKSTNGGLRWVKLKNGLPKKARRTRTLHLDLSDLNRLYAGTTVGLFMSSDGGGSWRNLISDVVVNSVVTDPQDGRVILVGTQDAGVLKSDNGGGTFSPSNQGFVHRKVAALAGDPGHSQRFYASVVFDQDYGGFFVWDSSSLTWERFNEGLGEGANSIRSILPSLHSRRVYLGTSSGLFRGVPSQAGWQPVEAARSLSILDLAFANDVETGLFLATVKGLFLLDLKQDELRELDIPLNDGKVSSVLYDESSDHLFAATDIGVFRSQNRGKTWTGKSRGLPDSPVSSLEKNGERLFCGTREGLFQSDNFAEFWSSCPGVYPVDIVAVQSNPVAKEQLIAADSLVGHLFRSDDSGATWRVLNPEPAGSRITSLAFGSSGQLLAGTASDGILQIQLGASCVERNP